MYVKPLQRAKSLSQIKYFEKVQRFERAKYLIK